MNDRLKLVGLITIVLVAVVFLIVRIQSEASQATGGAIDVNDPKVASELKKHYEGMASSGKGPTDARKEGPGSSMMGETPR